MVAAGRASRSLPHFPETGAAHRGSTRRRPERASFDIKGLRTAIPCAQPTTVSDTPSPPPPANAAAVVLLIAGRPGPAFPLAPGGEHVLGRATGSVVALADRLASRNHAAIRHDPATAAWSIADLGSRNGTWLDGERVSRAELADGSLIRIGTTELIFRLDAPVAEPSAATVGRTGRGLEQLS